MTQHCPAARIALAALALALGGCETLLPRPDAQQPQREWRELEPIESRRFTLSAPDQRVIGELQLIRARHDDTLVDIARAYNLGFDELVDANPGVDPWLPGAGTEILLPTRFVLPDAPREGIVLNIATKRLFYFPPAAPGEPQQVVTHPIGIGRVGWETPTGSTEVISKARDPVWFVPASIRREYAEAGNPLPRQVPPGPDNPLGHRVMGLGMPGYLIHGTNKPAGVGMRVSHGCVRLFPEDIEWLYEQVDIGVPVHIVNQPFMLLRSGDGLWLEVHRPLADDEAHSLEGLSARVRAAAVELGFGAEHVDEQQLDEVIAATRGIPRLVGALKSGPRPAAPRIVMNQVVHELAAQNDAAGPATGTGGP